MLRIRTIMVICTAFAVSTGIAYADSYLSLTQGVPGFAEATEKASSGDFSGFINSLYNMSIGLASVIAVFVIIYAGVRISTSDNAGIISELRSRVGMAVAGLVLLLGAYVFLTYINPDLVSFRLSGLGKINYQGMTNYIPTEVVTIDGVRYGSGKSGSQVYEELDAMPPADYQQAFGREPQISSMNDDGTVRLNSAEIMQLAGTNSGDSIGITSQSGTHVQGDALPDANDIDVTIDGQRAVAAAIRLCTDIPAEWAGASSLYKIIAKESGGVVGLPNYALRGYMQHRGISSSQMVQDIRANQFYSRHCCRVTSQSNREAGQNGTQRCNPNTQSGLMQFTRAQAQSGTRGYSHISGKCASAAGVGQLLNVNMHTYQPSGVAGYGNAAEEICGMLRYIKSRYSHPDQAWAKYINGVGY